VVDVIDIGHDNYRVSSINPEFISGSYTKTFTCVRGFILDLFQDR